MKNAMKIIRLFLFLCGFCLLEQMADPGSFVFAEEIIIITNKSVVEDYLSILDVKNIFLGNKKAWNNNKKIVLAVLKKNDTHKKFTRKYVKKNHTQFNNYWKNMVFTGKGKVPKRFQDEEELKDFVANTKDAIGYISSDLYTEDVKKIIVNGN